MTGLGAVAVCPRRSLIEPCCDDSSVNLGRQSRAEAPSLGPRYKERVLAALEPTHATTLATAYSLDYLLALVIYGAEEHLSLHTVEAALPFFAGLVVLLYTDGARGVR